jgi:hypothetical protein
MGSAVVISNWQGLQMPMQASLENGVYAAQNQLWLNQQANADTWASQAKANDDAWRARHEQDVTAWQEEQESWRTDWAIAQAAYAAAQTYLADKAFDAAEDAADKQYDIADRQQTIADEEYGRYSVHFAPCENTTVDTVCQRPEYTEDIEAQANRAVADVRLQFTIARQQLQRRRNRYCLGAVLAGEREIAIEEARATADAKEKVRRFLEERQDNRRDKYFNRKLQLFNIGRGIKADAVNDFGRAAQGIAQGTSIELEARNQYYGAILSSFGGLLGAFLPSGGAPMSTGFGASSSAMGGGYVGAPGLSINRAATQRMIAGGSSIA